LDTSDAAATATTATAIAKWENRTGKKTGIRNLTGWGRMGWNGDEGMSVQCTCIYVGESKKNEKKKSNDAPGIINSVT
jgi:hypothetical protein